MSNGLCKEVAKSPGSMNGELPSTRSRKRYDHCCGIHGAARERKGIKHARTTANRRYAKLLIEEELNEVDCDE